MKERNKYLSPPGRANRLYLVPGTRAEWLNERSLPIVITEGEKKALALHVLSWHALSDSADQARFLPIGIAGVWNWRGTIGKAPGPDGDRRDVKGPIPDLGRIKWDGRRVYILFDANVRVKNDIRAARDCLAGELTRRGAEVLFVDVPNISGVNGIDDLLGLWGPDQTLALFDSAESPASTGRSESRPSQATQLVLLVKRRCRLYHTPERQAFAQIDIDGHTEAYPIRSKGFREWLLREYFTAEKKAPSGQAVEEAIQIIGLSAGIRGDPHFRLLS